MEQKSNTWYDLNNVHSQIFSWLRSNVSFLLLLSVFAFALLNLSGKRVDIGEYFFPTLLFGASIVPILLGIYRQKREQEGWEGTLLSLFLILYIVSFSFSQTKNFGYSELIVWVGCILLYLGLSKIHFRKDWCWKVLVTLASVSTIIGFIFFLTKPAARLYGTFLEGNTISDNWPNAFALFILMVWPLALHVAVQKWNVLKSFILTLLLAGLFLTYSRAAYLIFLIQLAVIMWYFRGKIKKSLKFVLFGALIVIVIIAGTQYLRSQTLPTVSFKDRITFQTQEKGTSIRERWEFWNGAIKLIIQKPLFGSGPFSFAYVYPQVQQSFLTFSDHPHNIFLKIGQEAGIPALFAIVIFFFILARLVKKRFTYLNEEEQNETFFLCVALIGALLHSQLDYNFNFLANALLFWFLLACIRSNIAFPHLQKEKKIRSLTLIAALLLMHVLIEGSLSTFAKKAYEAEARYDFQTGERYFSYYENTLFPRNHFLKRFQTFRDEDNIDLAVEALKKHLKLNPIDSEAWERLGEVQREQGALRDSFESFRKALELNPMNHFWYYWNFFDTANRLGEKEEMEKVKPLALKLLKEYEWLLKNNIHYTAQTPNAEGAIKLAEFLEKLYPGEDI